MVTNLMLKSLTINPLVSVLMPCYNAEEYIEEAILSALSQSWSNIEIIVVDDSSTDNSLQIAKRYESDKVKIFVQPHSGTPRARNLAFEKSAGEYIQCLDADDLIAGNKIEEQLLQLTDKGLGSIAFCPFTRIKSEFEHNIFYKECAKQEYLNPIDLWLDVTWGKVTTLTHSWLVPRELIVRAGKWDERLVKHIDADFFIRVMLESHKIVYTETTGVFYRMSGLSSVSNRLDINALNSVLLSTLLDQERILKKEGTYRVRSAFIYMYSRIYCNYYNSQTKFILQELKIRVEKLGGGIYFVGNNTFNYLIKVIGLDRTLILKNFLKKVFKIRVRLK